MDNSMDVDNTMDSPEDDSETSSDDSMDSTDSMDSDDSMPSLDGSSDDDTKDDLNCEDFRVPTNEKGGSSLRSPLYRSRRVSARRTTASQRTTTTTTSSTAAAAVVDRRFLEGTEVALKVVTRNDPSSISAFWTELDALVSLQDPHNGGNHVVQLLGVCFDADYVVAVISYHRGGPLSKWWKRHRKLNRGQKVGEMAVSRVLFGVGKALTFCHASGRLHLDVKENNVVFGRGVGDVDQVVLIDFGCAVSVADTEGVVVDTGYDDYFEGGTFCCMAPEVLSIAVRALRHERLEDTTPVPCFGAKADVWSLGVMAHVLLTGRYPYGLTGERSDDIEAYELLQRMKRSNKSTWDGARDRKQLTVKAQKFLSRVLTIDVNQRPTLEEIMNDPYIVEHNRHRR